MKPRLHSVLLAFALASLPALAQMHKVAKPQQVVRAIGVYEWTGDFLKPNASRLIPVSLYIDGQFQDAGVYIARPVPFALLSGNVYELDSAGVSKGLLDLVYARKLQATDATGDLAYDDGWFGYGKVQPLAAPRHVAPLKASKNLPVLHSSVKDTTTTASTDSDPDRPSMKRRDSSSTSASTASTPSSTGSATNTTNTASTDDSDRPVMKRRDSSSASTTDSSSGTANSGTANSSTPADDPDRPVMKRRDSSGSTTDSTSSASGTPPADPDRPTMKRSSSTSDSDTASSGSATTDPNDPDRPTLKRRTPEEARKTRNANDSGSTLGYDSLNDDPNRPNLHYGKPTHALTETDLPKLTGLPADLHQMVAVSDAANRDPHPFALEWQDASEHAAVLAKLQALAQAQLAAYGKPNSAAAKTSAAKVAGSTVAKTSSTASHHSSTHTAAQPPQIALLDEDLKAYTLSYGGDPTYVYSAHTAGTGTALRYVTIVAQSDSLGQFKPAIQSVTDAAHLDVTPRMRFVDVVDAEASNRASLLFELRGQNARQFGLYRVIAGHSDQIFLTGTTQ